MHQKALNKKEPQRIMRQDEVTKTQKRPADLSQDTSQIRKAALSETEQLLNQIRSNIMQQKHGQTNIPLQSSIEDSSSLSFEEKQVSLNKMPRKKKSLCKITEASVEQHPVETVVEGHNFSIRRDQRSTRKPKLLNIST